MCSYIIYIITKYTAQHIFQQLFIDTLLERISFGTINASIQLVFFFFFFIKIQSDIQIIFEKKSMKFLFHTFISIFRGNGEIISLIGFATNFHCRIVKFILSCIMRIVRKFITTIRNYGRL